MSRPHVNPEEAPEGYKAVREESCKGCAFDRGACRNATGFACIGSFRKDHYDVIFKKIAKRPKKIAIRSPDKNWKNNDIQFPRLLAEMVAAGIPTEAQMQEICESMDLLPDQVDDILDRAQEVWDDIKKRTSGKGKRVRDG